MRKYRLLKTISWRGNFRIHCSLILGFKQESALPWHIPLTSVSFGEVTSWSRVLVRKFQIANSPSPTSNYLQIWQFFIYQILFSGFLNWLHCIPLFLSCVSLLYLLFSYQCTCVYAYVYISTYISVFVSYYLYIRADGVISH
jgi:hypothetical protein